MKLLDNHFLKNNNKTAVWIWLQTHFIVKYGTPLYLQWGGKKRMKAFHFYSSLPLTTGWASHWDDCGEPHSGWSGQHLWQFRRSLMISPVLKTQFPGLNIFHKCYLGSLDIKEHFKNIYDESGVSKSEACRFKVYEGNLWERCAWGKIQLRSFWNRTIFFKFIFQTSTHIGFKTESF